MQKKDESKKKALKVKTNLKPGYVELQKWAYHDYRDFLRNA